MLYGYIFIKKCANNHDDDYALQISYLQGHFRMVKMFLKKGANVNANNNLALRWSIEGGHSKVTKLLLDHGAQHPFYTL